MQCSKRGKPNWGHEHSLPALTSNAALLAEGFPHNSSAWPTSGLDVLILQHVSHLLG